MAQLITICFPDGYVEHRTWPREDLPRIGTTIVSLGSEWIVEAVEGGRYIVAAVSSTE